MTVWGRGYDGVGRGYDGVWGVGMTVGGAGMTERGARGYGGGWKWGGRLGLEAVVAGEGAFGGD